MFSFIAKQPSGRPRLPKRVAKRCHNGNDCLDHAAHEAAKGRHASSSTPYSTEIYTVSSPILPGILQQDQVQTFPGSVPGQNTWSESWSLDDTRGDIEHMLILEEERDNVSVQELFSTQTASPLTAPSALPDGLLTPKPINSGTYFYPNRQAYIVEPNKSSLHEIGRPTSEADIVRQTDDLARLSLRIYQLQLVAGSALPSPLLCDDITSVTRCLLMSLGDAPTGAREINKHHTTSDSAPPASSFANGQWSDIRARRQSIESLVYQDEASYPAIREIDPAVTFLVLACYQRLLNLFQHICVSIHVHVDHVGSPEFSTTQIIMTTELINHLLERLDRDLKRIFEYSPASDNHGSISCPHVSKLSFASNVSAGATFSDVWPRVNFDEFYGTSFDVSLSQHRNVSPASKLVASGPQQNSRLQSLAAVVDSMTRKQSAIHAHIGVIRHMIQASERI